MMMMMMMMMMMSFDACCLPLCPKSPLQRTCSVWVFDGFQMPGYTRDGGVIMRYDPRHGDAMVMFP